MHDWLKKRDFLITLQVARRWEKGESNSFFKAPSFSKRKVPRLYFDMSCCVCLEWVFNVNGLSFILPAKWSPEIYGHYFHIDRLFKVLKASEHVHWWESISFISRQSERGHSIIRISVAEPSFAGVLEWKCIVFHLFRGECLDFKL